MAAKYPHLLPRERLLWERFLLEHGGEFQWFDYDIRVGEGVPGPIDETDPFQRMRKALTQKRIDVVGLGPAGVLWLFEVKPHLGVTAMGSLVTYETLYRRTFGYGGPIQLALVGATIDYDLQQEWQARGVQIYLYPDLA